MAVLNFHWFIGPLGGGILSGLVGIGLIRNGVIVPGMVLAVIGVALIFSFILVVREEIGREKAATGFPEEFVDE